MRLNYGLEISRKVNKLKETESLIRNLESEIQQLKRNNHFLSEELSVRAQEMQALLNGAKLMLAGNSFLKTSKAIFNYCRELTGAKAGYIALLNKEKMENEILFLEPGGFFCSVPLDLPMPIRGFRATAYETGRTVYDNHYAKSKHKKLMPEGHIPLNNVMFAPIKMDGETIGLMGLGEKDGDFNENDKRIVTTLTELISIALTNSRMLEELKESREKLDKLNTTKDKFFSIIAHDLKNPFAALSLSSELIIRMLQKNNLDVKKLTDYVNVIADSASTGRKLLDNLLKWSMSQFGNIDYNPVMIKLNDAVRESVSPLVTSAKNKKIEIKSFIPDDYFVIADSVMLETVLRNLVSNAIKFTKARGEVMISARKRKDEIIVSVKDNGVGISKEVMRRLFRIEDKYTSQGTAKEKGTGLGLILCKEFVEKHGGKIWVNSTVGKGSEFKFTLKAE